MDGLEVSFLVPDDNGTKRLCAITYGDKDVAGSKGVVLCCHGFQDNARSFARLAPMLASFGFYVVCLEFTGHGKSDHAAAAAGNHFAYTHDVVDVADCLGVPHFHLIGHSMGGIVTAMVAGALVGRVSSLVLIDTIGAIGTMSDEEAPEILERSLQQRSSVVHRKPRIYDSFDECVSRWAEGPWAPVGRDAVALIVERGTELIYDPRSNSNGYRFRHDPRLKSAPAYKVTERQALAFLARVQCPVLALLANDREAFWPEEVRETHMKALRALVIELSGGHHLHLTNAKMTCDALIKFYQDSRVLQGRSRL